MEASINRVVLFRRGEYTTFVNEIADAVDMVLNFCQPPVFLGEYCMNKPKPRFSEMLYNYRHASLLLLVLFLIHIFNILERIVVPQYWISCSLDSYIPFLPIFVIPYAVWYLYVAFGLVFLCLKDKKVFVPTVFLLCAGMGIALVLYYLFPHGQPLRPDSNSMGTDPFSLIIQNVIYANDTNTNCCPSIHVLDQLAIHIGLCRSKYFKNRRWFKNTSLVVSILVCASTVFIKQHSILDVLLALVLEAMLYWVFFRSGLRQRIVRVFTSNKKRLAYSGNSGNIG